MLAYQKDNTIERERDREREREGICDMWDGSGVDDADGWLEDTQCSDGDNIKFGRR